MVCAYGGGSMYEQSKACEEGAEIIVATPVSSATAAIDIIIVLILYNCQRPSTTGDQALSVAVACVWNSLPQRVVSRLC